MTRFNPRYASLCRLAFIVWLASSCVSAAADKDKRKPLKGEVDQKTAYVQTFDHDTKATRVLIEARIKVLRGGSYVVAGGYYKGEYMHKKYYTTKVIKAEAGDTVTVKLTAPLAPKNNRITVAVYAAEKDIQAKS